MSMDIGAVLRGNYLAHKAQGDKIIDADAQFIPHGHEDIRLLFKEFPHPTPLGSGEFAETFGTNGLRMLQPTTPTTAQEGNFSLYMLANGLELKFFESILAGNGRFDADVVEGSMESHLRKYMVRDVILKPEQIQRSNENRTQIVVVTGTMGFNYFGEYVDGNTATLYGQRG